MSRTALLLVAISSIFAGCAVSATSADPSPESLSGGPSGGKADNAAACFTVAAEPLSEVEPTLVETGNIPLPALGPDADGWFHPPMGYSEGGSFTAAEDRPEWQVDASSIAPPATPGTLRVVEWNVERGNQLDAEIRLMKRVNADVWVLNESDLYGKNSHGVVVAREVARALGYSYYTTTEFYELRQDRRGMSGNAIVSRYPLLDGRRMTIPMFLQDGGYDWSTSTSEPRCGQRSAISVHIDAPDGNGGSVSVNVVTLHTENKANGGVRREQFDTVRDELVVPGEPTIMAGDLNTVSMFEGSSFRGYLSDRWNQLGPSNAQFDCSRGDDTTTFTAATIVKLRIDWMLLQPGDSSAVDCPVGSYQVLGNDGASDHKPVVTEFRVGTPQ